MKKIIVFCGIIIGMMISAQTKVYASSKDFQEYYFRTHNSSPAGSIYTEAIKVQICTSSLSSSVSQLNHKTKTSITNEEKAPLLPLFFLLSIIFLVLYYNSITSEEKTVK